MPTSLRIVSDTEQTDGGDEPSCSTIVYSTTLPVAGLTHWYTTVIQVTLVGKPANLSVNLSFPAY